jgi:hypothetical protein
MRKVVLMMTAFFLVAAMGSAASLCTSFSGPQNVASGDFSCTLGGLTFSDFEVVAAAGNPAPEVDLVSAKVAGTWVYLVFNPNMSAPPGGTAQDLYLYYKVSGGVTAVGQYTGGVNATVTEHVCDTAFDSSNLCTTNELVNMASFSGAGTNVVVSPSFASTLEIFIFKDIGVSPNSPNAGGGGLTTFAQSFNSTGSTGGGGAGGEVPEPITFILMGSGLVGLSLLKRVRRA